jgi:predicted DNA-binding transcriptional regulator YafY
MSKRESISRYNLIINKLRRGPSDFNTICDYLQRASEFQDENFVVSKRTFVRDLNDIRTLFNINITYDFSRKVYFIEDVGQFAVNDRLLEAFDTFNAFNVAESLSRHIYFEQRRPGGTESLSGILYAIKNNLYIKFTYHKFWEEIGSKRTTEPYALKEFKSRWYVLAKDVKDSRIKSFALDRLYDLDITRKTFKKPAEQNFDDTYHHSFGIISSDDEPVEILLSFDPFQGKYIKTLPIHHSQHIQIDTDKELRLKLKLRITHDFVMELLSFSHYMKVLEPKSLADTIKQEHHKAYLQY